MDAAVWEGVLFAVAGVGALTVLCRPLLHSGEPWPVAWLAPVGAVLLLAAWPAGFPLWLLVTGLTVLLAGMTIQVVWAHHRGRYLDDDVVALWGLLRGRRRPRRTGRHRGGD